MGRFAVGAVLGGMLLLALSAAWLLAEAEAPPAPTPPPRPAPVPAPGPQPCPPDRPCPRPRPRLDRALATIVPAGQLTVGGPVAPDGRTQVQCDLPLALRAKNIGGRDGAGLCVFTSIMHAARDQNERRLWDFQAKMRAELGGGWPGKVDAMIAKYGPGTPYLQYEGKDPSILLAALASGRMPAVTYDGRDPHYQGHVDHMVNLVFLDSGQACVLDNNFVGDTELVWMSASDFLSRWTAGGQGWAVVLLAPAPAPVPRLPPPLLSASLPFAD